MPDPLLPTRSVPSFASDPRYLEELKARKLRELQSRQPTPSTVSPSFHSRNAMAAAEGPMLDGMQASELFYDRPVPQLRSARDAAIGDMSFGIAQDFMPPARTNTQSMGRANPSAEGPLLDDMLAAELFKRAREQQDAEREREGMVRRMEAQGYTR